MSSFVQRLSESLSKPPRARLECTRRAPFAGLSREEGTKFPGNSGEETASNDSDAWLESRREDATNQPKELPVLRVLQDFRLSLRDLVAQGVCCRVLASTLKMSHLHAASLPADFCAHR